ncbi:MAG: flagellar hook-associated 2 domain protein, partial [Actinomycetia bacterium]|nr:flagellar hook-associated 2 domain protein [Actinomycetes bacterium]
TNALGLVARVESGVLQVRSATYGAAPTFTLTTDGALAISSLFAGTDVAGTINGAYAKGSGQALLGEAADPVTHGLSFLITATPAEVATAAAQVGANQNLFGTFSYNPGLAQRFDSVAGDAVRTGTGRLSLLIAGKQDQMAKLTLAITDWDTRLQTKEDSYKRQYAGLEVALGKLKSQSTWLSGQLSSLPTSP